MAMWADYGISRVKYNDAHTHIVKVIVHQDNDESIGQAQEWKREQVVSSLESGKTFVTILKNAEGKWTKGQPVRVVTINKVKYIRTDENNKEADNLGNLPEF